MLELGLMPVVTTMPCPALPRPEIFIFCPALLCPVHPCFIGFKEKKWDGVDTATMITRAPAVLKIGITLYRKSLFGKGQYAFYPMKLSRFIVRQKYQNWHNIIQKILL